MAVQLASLSQVPAEVYWFALFFAVPGAVNVLFPSVARAWWEYWYEIRCSLWERGYLLGSDPPPTNNDRSLKSYRISGFVFMAIAVAIIIAAAWLIG